MHQYVNAGAFKTIDQAREYLIKDSLYSDGIKNNVPADILTKLIKLYSFDLDFQRDIRSNTKVSVSFESIIIEDRKEIFFGDRFKEVRKNMYRQEGDRHCQGCPVKGNYFGI